MPEISLPIGTVEYLAVAFHGSKFSPRVMTEKFLGGPIDHAPYVRYLTGRVNEFYS